MRGRRTQSIMAAMAVSVCFLLMAAASYATEVVIGSNSTDIGTIIFVSPKFGDPALTNGDALVNTLGRIMDASAANRYLIKLGPGTYDLVATGLQMKEYVSIEGSGEKATKITAAVSSNPLTTATVMGANNAELRYLTVENTGTGDFTAGILNMWLNPSTSLSLIHVTAIASGGTSQNLGIYNNSSSPTMTNVTATASGPISVGVNNWYESSPTMTNVTATATGTARSIGVINNWACSSRMTNVMATASGGTQDNIGVENSSSLPTMTNVTATASGGINSYGVYNYLSSLTMANVTATASGGTNNYGVYSDGTVVPARIVRISHSVITGATNTIFNGSNVTTLVRHTQLGGGAVSNAGTLTCAGSYDGIYKILDASCR